MTVNKKQKSEDRALKQLKKSSYVDQPNRMHTAATVSRFDFGCPFQSLSLDNQTYPILLV